MTDDVRTYLPSGLPVPAPEPDQLSTPFLEGLRQSRLLIQRCSRCGTWRWGPEWICHECNSFEVDWVEVEPKGRIFSYERVWHPVHPALKDAVPYVVVLVELPQAGGTRLVGNLLGDPNQELKVGTPVVGKFEHHRDAALPYSLLQWRRAG